MGDKDILMKSYKKITKWVRKIFDDPNPLKKCLLCKSEGCSFVDGYLCKFPNCTMNDKFIADKFDESIELSHKQNK